MMEQSWGVSGKYFHESKRLLGQAFHCFRKTSHYVEGLSVGYNKNRR